MYHSPGISVRIDRALSGSIVRLILYSIICVGLNRFLIKVTATVSNLQVPHFVTRRPWSLYPIFAFHSQRVQFPYRLRPRRRPASRPFRHHTNLEIVKAKQDDATKRWFANADAIADFLSKANPKNWPQAEMRAMMHDHLKLTTNEVVARLHGDWAGDVAAYDAVHEQILKMADMLAMGIANQFPGKV